MYEWFYSPQHIFKTEKKWPWNSTEEFQNTTCFHSSKKLKTFPFSNILIGCSSVLSDLDALAKCRVHHELKLKDRTTPLLKDRTQELKRKQTEGLKNVSLFLEKFEMPI